MSLVTVSRQYVDTRAWMPFGAQNAPISANITMDAAGESGFVIGYLIWASGPGTSKTVSAAGGGKFWWRTGSVVTFANAGTSLVGGIQDLSGSVEDGSFDVSFTLVGGTDTININTVRGDAMESGTKTIAYGATVALGFEMTARGGADSVTVSRQLGAGSMHYLSLDTGSGPTPSVQQGGFAVQADDGTLGWILGSNMGGISATALNVDSTPDEYARIFQVPFKCALIGITAIVDNVISTDTFELVAYSDPTGTPAILGGGALTINPALNPGATEDYQAMGLFAAPVELNINTDYAVSFRPTSTGNITLSRLGFGTGNGALLRGMQPCGEAQSEGTRTGNAGAFASDTDFLPFIAPIIAQLDNGVSASGGGLNVLGGRGGVIL